MPILSRKSPPQRVLLLRHAHRADEGDTPSSGLGLPPLSPLGHRQARAFAASIDTAPDLVVVSSFLRSVQTAAPLLERFPGMSVETWRVEEFTFLPPSLYVGTTIRDRAPQNDAYWRAGDPDLHPGPGGESFREFVARVDAALDRLRARAEPFVVVVSHGFTIQTMLWRLRSPRRLLDRAAMADWKCFGAARPLAPTASVELSRRSGDEGFVAGDILPPPLSAAHIPREVRA
jgi:broad specificity phosphatase PhoE